MTDLSLGVVMAALGAGLAAIMAGIGSIIGIGYPGRAAAGVIGMRLEEGNRVVDMAIATGDDILTVTENGFGKRTPLEDYRVTKRGAKGVRTIITNQRNGRVVAVREVSDGDEIVLSSREGMMVRIPVGTIRRQGRNTQRHV